MIKQGTTLVKANASNSELQNAIEAAIPQAVQQTKTIAPRYKGAIEAESCKKIFDYLKNHVNYKADGANQQVRLPSALMRTLQGDCKSYSVYTSAILTNLGIPHKLVYASYDPKDPTPTHIYVITNKGCIVDAVYGKFNAEKKASNKKYKNMNISYIAGMGKKSRIGSMGKYGTGGACGIGGVDTGETWAKKLGIWDSIPGITKFDFYKNISNPLYAGGRELVKALLRKNSGGFATALNDLYNIARANNATPEFTKYRKLELIWLQKGGNPDELRVAFQEGSTKTPTGYKFHEILVKQKAGQSVSTGEWIAAAVSAVFGKKYDPATGKITGGGIGAFGADDAAEAAATAAVWIPIIKEVIGMLADAFKPGATQPGPGDTITPPTSSSTSSMLLPVLLVGGAAAAYFVFKPKKK
jgi:hypothetical protein